MSNYIEVPPCSVCSRPLIFPEGRVNGAVSACKHVIFMGNVRMPEHMPWLSAHSEYDAGYNAGIAAAAVALGLMAAGREAITAVTLDAAAKTILALMRPEAR